MENPAVGIPQSPPAGDTRTDVRVSYTDPSSPPEAFVRRANTSEVDAAALRAYFPDVVDATGVATVRSDKEEEQFQRRRQRTFLTLGGCVCLAIALSVIIPLVLSSSDDSPQVVLSTPQPSMAPSEAPSAAPTEEDVSEELTLTIELLRENSNGTVLETEEWWNNGSSPQYRAAKWLSEEDNNYTGDIPELLQRFALGTFYYATSSKEDDWVDCGVISGGCQGDPWLSSSDECTWGYVNCQNETGPVTELRFRK